MHWYYSKLFKNIKAGIPGSQQFVGWTLAILQGEGFHARVSEAAAFYRTFLLAGLDEQSSVVV